MSQPSKLFDFDLKLFLKNELKEEKTTSVTVAEIGKTFVLQIIK
jgi:hypothetical protein